MLTNEKIAAIHANAVAHGFWEPGEEPTFGEYCAFIHEEISEAFSAWRNGEPYAYIKDGKPEGVWVELADVVIRCADMFGRAGVKLCEEDERYKWLSHCARSTILNEQHASFAEFANILHHTVSHAYGINRGKGMDSLLSAVLCVFARAELENIDLDAIIDRKCAYNATRPYKHGKRM